jgi:SAM-dependent methyltransferase
MTLSDPDYLWLHLRDLPYFRALLRAVESRLMQQIDLPAPVLDIGSGDGHFASVTYKTMLDLGVDPAVKPTREAKRRGAYRLLVLADGTGLPCSNGSFASAMSNSVLEHVERLEEVLAEVWRVLKPGAPFAFTVPNPGYRSQLSIPRFLRRLALGRLAVAYEDWFMWISRTRNLLDETTWRKLLEQVGFEVERSQPYFSSRALRVLEWGHYFGAPCLLSRWTMGRWILAPTRWNLWLTEQLVRPYYEELPSDDGTYTFYLARKR